ncbi:hypothetical protein [Pseudoalteromonas sp. NGC95]|uniref:hypothetical protein n=1 Tax=Pseudoalteromonas sp. NGC95 TaxID=2792051 RepID=UPI0018CCE6B0|nr:hypothetical protein [Pseudoalteromonas sp. NGC95]MBH0018708.1 hypothetical protein [Pseudoalteromonas sp. NGC95]
MKVTYHEKVEAHDVESQLDQDLSGVSDDLKDLLMPLKMILLMNSMVYLTQK